MVDTKLSALTQGTTPPDFYYGEQGLVSKKWQSLRLFNILDYGAVGDDSHDDAPAIQAACNAATDHAGGIVWFPPLPAFPGAYRLGSSVLIGCGARSPAYAGIILMGAGGDCASETGSFIRMAGSGYAFYISQTGHPVKAIHGLAIKNQVSFTCTSAEPPGDPDGFGGSFDRSGGGCVYIGSGIGFKITDCDFQTNHGICVHQAAGFGLGIWGTNFSGGFTGSGWAGSPFGVTSAQSVTIGPGKMYGLSTCVAIFGYTSGHGSLLISGQDIETSGFGVTLGPNVVGFYQTNPPQFNPQFSISGTNDTVIQNVGMESMFVGNILVAGCNNLTVEDCVFASYQGNPDPIASIIVAACQCAVLQNLSISGFYQKTVMDIGSGLLTTGPIVPTYGQMQNLKLINVQASGGAGAVTVGARPGGDPPLGFWTTPQAARYQPGDIPATYNGCNTDGAVPLANLPVAPNVPSFLMTDPVVITNCDFPLWTGGGSPVSNAGRPATAVGPANNKVLVRWSPVASAWVLC